jgi:hypothetical protein
MAKMLIQTDNSLNESVNFLSSLNEFSLRFYYSKKTQEVLLHEFLLSKNYKIQKIFINFKKTPKIFKNQKKYSNEEIKNLSATEINEIKSLLQQEFKKKINLSKLLDRLKRNEEKIVFLKKSFYLNNYPSKKKEENEINIKIEKNKIKEEKNDEKDKKKIKEDEDGETKEEKNDEKDKKKLKKMKMMIFLN